MIIIKSDEELAGFLGQEIGVSDWLTVDQQMIDRFADATGDHQWIHVDQSRAATSPFGTTIAHGFLLISLLPALKQKMVRFDFAEMAINYGSDRVRFLSPVAAGSRVRLRVALKNMEESPMGMKLFTRNHLEIEGQEKYALVADTITLVIKKGS